MNVISTMRRKHVRLIVFTNINESFHSIHLKYKHGIIHDVHSVVTLCYRYYEFNGTTFVI
jgi:hypothetical protein